MGELIVSPGALKRVPNLEEAFAIIVNGDTASQAIGEEQYVYVRNHSTLSYGLYMATSAIAIGDAISSSNLSPVSEGGLNALFDKISYNGVDVSITIPSSGWSSSSPYVYTWTDARVTSRCRVIMDFVKGANNGEIPYLDFEKVSGGVKFTAPKKPTQVISVIIHIINAVEQAITNVNGNDVSTSAVDGAANVEEALAAQNQAIGELNSNKLDKYDAGTITATDANNAIALALQKAYTAGVVNASKKMAVVEFLYGNESYMAQCIGKGNYIYFICHTWNKIYNGWWENSTTQCGDFTDVNGKMQIYRDNIGNIGTVENGATVETNVQHTHATKYGHLVILRLRLTIPTITETTAVFQFASRYVPAYIETYWQARNIWDSSIIGMFTVNSDGHIYAQTSASGKDLTIDIAYIAANYN